MLKRFFDICFAITALILMCPLIITVGLFIKLDSQGQIFYRGVRTGRYGVPFRIFKFRTMHPNMEKQGGDTTAFDDPRITRTGRFLRKHKIDELPQFINVLKGEMSIVGPRPELLYYTERYSESEKCILDVKPGITDLSSISFYSLADVVGRGDEDRIFEETVLPIKNQLRIRYVKEQSFWFDVWIIFRTISVMLTKVLGIQKCH